MQDHDGFISSGSHRNTPAFRPQKRKTSPTKSACEPEGSRVLKQHLEASGMMSADRIAADSAALPKQSASAGQNDPSHSGDTGNERDPLQLTEEQCENLEALLAPMAPVPGHPFYWSVRHEWPETPYPPVNLPASDVARQLQPQGNELAFQEHNLHSAGTFAAADQLGQENAAHPAEDFQNVATVNPLVTAFSPNRNSGNLGQTSKIGQRDPELLVEKGLPGSRDKHPGSPDRQAAKAMAKQKKSGEALLAEAALSPRRSLRESPVEPRSTRSSPPKLDSARLSKSDTEDELMPSPPLTRSQKAKQPDAKLVALSVEKKPMKAKPTSKKLPETTSPSQTQRSQAKQKAVRSPAVLRGSPNLPKRPASSRRPALGKSLIQCNRS